VSDEEMKKSSFKENTIPKSAKDAQKKVFEY
jgi:hypothetical protein